MTRPTGHTPTRARRATATTPSRVTALAARLGFDGPARVATVWGALLAAAALARTATVRDALEMGEKTWRYGKGLGIVFGAGLVVLACFVPSHPGLVPGLHLDGATSM
jgi:purine-cytosine permease-like protein